MDIIGYDNNGRVLDAGDHIRRVISHEYRPRAGEIYDIYKKHNLVNIGIVDTELDTRSKNFKHKKHIISYPYEWPAEMYKDAILFHLKLFIELDKYGLLLKDAIPSNILFDGYKPVFVDFLSIIKKERLNNETWLIEEDLFKDKRFSIVERMLIPFVINPLLAMGDKNYRRARLMLSEKACNVEEMKSRPKEKKIIGNQKTSGWLKKYLKNLILKRKDRKRISILLNSFKCNKELGFIDYIKNLYELFSNIDVAPPSSAYAGYYDGKKENHDFTKRDNWGEKQKNVYDILKREKPGTVIDIGANTGWFSFLAENMGSKVIAMDIDEYCVNTIYRITKKESKNILPLIISFEDLTKKYYGYVEKGQEYSGRDFKNTPLFLAPEDRFRGDLILCLGLIHHLVLGMGHEISFIFQVLSQMTNKSVLLEFIGINDPLIKDEPAFFRNLYKYNERTYNFDLIINEGKKFFKYVEVFGSHPGTRKLILFKN